LIALPSLVLGIPSAASAHEVVMPGCGEPEFLFPEEEAGTIEKDVVAITESEPGAGPKFP